ncbi:hypothetical protein OSTOST_06800, partial [Ostertagia ostertagi]
MRNRGKDVATSGQFYRVFASWFGRPKLKQNPTQATPVPPETCRATAAVGDGKPPMTSSLIPANASINNILRLHVQHERCRLKSWSTLAGDSEEQKESCTSSRSRAFRRQESKHSTEEIECYCNGVERGVEVVNVNLSDKPKFLFEKHPDGRVPILEHNNKTIIESSLIAEYLDWISPAKPILPADPYLKARQRMITAQLEAKLPAAAYALVNEQRFPAEKKPTMAMLHEALILAEKLLTDIFYGGREPGFADYMTYPFMERIWIWTH